MSHLRISSVLAASASLLLTAIVAVPAQAGGNPGCGSPSGIGTSGFTSGDGTLDHPYLIANADDLNELHDCLAPGLYFKLTDNINMLHQTWDPIGEYVGTDIDTGFSGVLDGNNKTIDNLVVRGDTNQVGFFGKLELGSQVKDLSLIGSASGPSDVGMLAGEVDSALIDNVYVATDIYGGRNVGGLVGLSVGSTILRDVAVDPLDSGSAIVAPRAQNVGGIVGRYLGNPFNRVISSGNYSSIDVRVSDATATLAQTQSAGGLFGALEFARINESGSDGDVLAPGIAFVGGAVGYTSDTDIARVAAYGRVDGSTFVGGLLGGALDNFAMSETFATGNVTAYSADAVTGGLVGLQCATPLASSTCTVSNSFARGRVTGVLSSGFVGTVAATPDVSLANNYSVATFDPENDESYGFVSGGVVTNTDNVGNFWNTTVARLDSGSPAVRERGLATAAMTKFVTFAVARWDIKQGWTSPDSRTAHIWGICKNVNDGFPFLNWAYDANPCVPFTHKPTLFKSTKFVLDATAKKALDVVVADIADQGYTSVNISGYASLNGKPSKAKTAAALTLSTKRASAVKTYLTAGLRKKAIVGVVFVTKGFGVACPAASNKTAAGRSKNDRVQIVVQ